MTAVAGPLTGREAKTYRNAGTHASPTAVLIDFIENLQLNLPKDKAELKDRSSKWKKKKGGHREASISFKYNYRKHTTDTNFAAFQDSFLNDTPIEIIALDDLITESGAKGFRGYFEVFQFDRKEDAGDIVSYDVGMDLTYKEESSTVVEPDFYEVT